MKWWLKATIVRYKYAARDIVMEEFDHVYGDMESVAGSDVEHSSQVCVSSLHFLACNLSISTAFHI